MAALAWNRKTWLGLSITEVGPPVAREEHQADKRHIVAWSSARSVWARSRFPLRF